jgi:hypothetical protein
MAQIEINISLGDPATGNLTMTPAAPSVDQGDIVTWIIAANSGVAAITKISEKPMSFDLFNPDPVPVPNSTSWQGTVNPLIGDGQEETYYINWTTAGTGWLGKDGKGLPKTFDPKIIIKPVNPKP